MSAEASRAAGGPGLAGRYLRNQSSISEQSQALLAAKTVAMVGLGGLGGLVLETLARMGVGRIRGADGDVFEASNLNRQLLSREDLLGAPKARAAAQRVGLINSEVVFEPVEAFLDAESLPAFLAGADLVMDCLGGMAHRGILQKAASDAGLPMVTAAVAGFTGIVSTVFPGERGPADFFGCPAQAAEDRLGCPMPTLLCTTGHMCMEAVRLLIGESPLYRCKMHFIDLSCAFSDVSLLT